MQAALAAPSTARCRTRNTTMLPSMAMPGCFEPGFTSTSMCATALRSGFWREVKFAGGIIKLRDVADRFDARSADPTHEVYVS